MSQSHFMPEPKKQKLAESPATLEAPAAPVTPRLSPVETPAMPPPLVKKEPRRRNIDIESLKMMSRVLQERLNTV
jgi:hypothetical protein